jgi:hypothetical protein
MLGIFGAALAIFSTEMLKLYGALLFLFSPLILGYGAGAFARERGERRLKAFLLGQVAIVLEAAILLVFGFEGVICLIMAWPLAAAGAALGTWIAHTAPRRSKVHANASASALALLPFAMIIEDELLPAPELHSVSSVIEIGAPPEAVWPNVVAFAHLPPANEGIFRLGLAYPIRAEIEGSGVGAVRRCVFSTGAFVEPITVWDEPRRLAFTVERNPPPMTELSPYGEIHPPHLDGYFWSERGEFRLEPLPGDRTRLIGTTWYRQKLWPATYWLTWSDYVIHAIHLRVLRHIQERSEG